MSANHTPFTDAVALKFAAPSMFVFDKFDVPVTPSVDDNVVAPDAANVVTDVAAALNVASVLVPVTPNVPPIVAAPDAANVVTDVASAANV